MPAGPTPFKYTASPALQYILVMSPSDGDRELPLLPELRKYQVSLLFNSTISCYVKARHTQHAHLLKSQLITRLPNTHYRLISVNSSSALKISHTTNLACHFIETRLVRSASVCVLVWAPPLLIHLGHCLCIIQWFTYCWFK